MLETTRSAESAPQTASNASGASRANSSSEQEEKSSHGFWSSLVDKVSDVVSAAKEWVCDAFGIGDEKKGENPIVEQNLREKLETAAKAPSNYHLGNTEETVKQHIDELLRDSSFSRTPAGTANVVFMGDGNRSYSENHEHAGILFVAEDGSVDFYHSSKSNPGELSIMEHYSSYTAFEADFAYDTFYYQKVNL